MRDHLAENMFQEIPSVNQAEFYAYWAEWFKDATSAQQMTSEVCSTPTYQEPSAFVSLSYKIADILFTPLGQVLFVSGLYLLLYNLFLLVNFSAKGEKIVRLEKELAAEKLKNQGLHEPEKPEVKKSSLDVKEKAKFVWIPPSLFVAAKYLDEFFPQNTQNLNVTNYLVDFFARNRQYIDMVICVLVYCIYFPLLFPPDWRPFNASLPSVPTLLWEYPIHCVMTTLLVAQIIGDSLSLGQSVLKSGPTWRAQLEGKIKKPALAWLSNELQNQKNEEPAKDDAKIESSSSSAKADITPVSTKKNFDVADEIPASYFAFYVYTTIIQVTYTLQSIIPTSSLVAKTRKGLDVLLAFLFVFRIFGVGGLYLNVIKPAPSWITTQFREKIKKPISSWLYKKSQKQKIEEPISNAETEAKVEDLSSPAEVEASKLPKQITDLLPAETFAALLGITVFYICQFASELKTVSPDSTILLFLDYPLFVIFLAFVPLYTGLGIWALYPIVIKPASGWIIPQFRENIKKLVSDWLSKKLQKQKIEELLSDINDEAEISLFLEDTFPPYIDVIAVTIVMSFSIAAPVLFASCPILQFMNDPSNIECLCVFMCLGIILSTICLFLRRIAPHIHKQFVKLVLTCRKWEVETDQYPFQLTIVESTGPPLVPVPKDCHLDTFNVECIYEVPMGVYEEDDFEMVEAEN